jgi:type I site-specific restriction-modification system R (restriction) subunit
LCEITKYPTIGYHANQVDNLRDLIDKRDHIAHCSGVLDLDEEDILSYARKCVKYAQEIHSRIENATLASWDEFINLLNDDGGQYTLVHDAVIEYLAAEYISVADILTILKKRPLQDSESSETAFKSNLALMQIALIAEDYDTSQELAETLKLSILSHKISEDQLNQVQDENKAYVQFRVGLIR